jgi:hypothetical protein
LYLLPVSLAAANAGGNVEMTAANAGSNTEIIAALRMGEEQRTVTGSLAGRQVRDLLLRAIACEERFSGFRGELIASHTAALGDICRALPLVQSRATPPSFTVTFSF